MEKCELNSSLKEESGKYFTYRSSKSLNGMNGVEMLFQETRT